MTLCTCLVTLFAVFLAIFYISYCQSCKPKQQNRFGSFAPVRNECQAKWFVDGENYMAAVADAIQSASNEIFITDWQLNPHIFMKRSSRGVNSLEWRLDKMLIRKADEGISIYILLYWESKIIAGMDLGSSFCKSVLDHPNITVLRHPDMCSVLRYRLSGTGLLSHHEKIVVVDRKIAFVGGIDLCFGRWDTHNHDLTDDYLLHPCVEEGEQCQQETEGDSSRYCRWVGKDYGNVFVGGDRAELDKPMKDYINRSRHPRMPWHDVACSFTGSPVHDVTKHFIQRYNYIRPWNRDELHIDPEDIDSSDFIRPPTVNNNLKMQVLRSIDRWSAGQPHEASILSAYLDAINKSEHFIYIENQFFISSQPNFSVENEILATLVNRILYAYERNEHFHVMVVMPLKPELPGEWCADSGKHMQRISNLNYLSIYNGEDSVYGRLKKRGVPLHEIPRFFNVYGLRTHDILNGNLVTEIIYVHSKILIVDDKKAIIGSANINDRSMLGSRDSEIAVMIEDVAMINGSMRDQPYQVGKFSHSLRCHLVREHLGLLSQTEYETSTLKVEDPLTDVFRTRVSNIAMNNTQIYERVFSRKIIPTDVVKNCDDFMNWSTVNGLADVDPEEAKELLKEVRGHLVTFPAFFLKDVFKPVLNPASVLFYSKLIFWISALLLLISGLLYILLERLFVCYVRNLHTWFNVNATKITCERIK